MAENQLPKHILVGVALGGGIQGPAHVTQQDRSIVHRAAALACKLGARLDLLHTIEWSEILPADDITARLKSEREQTLAILTELVKKECKGKIEVNVSVEMGHPWHCLITEAKKRKADLLVVGPVVHRPGIFSRLIHGSTTGRLIRKSPVPVLKITSENDTPYKRMLVPVDFTSVSEKLVALANNLHAKTGAERHLLHCLRYPLEITYHQYPNPDAAVAEYHHEVLADAEKKIDQLIGSDRKGWHVHLSREWVTQSAPELIHRYGIDLLVVAGISLPSLAGQLLGTTAEKILENVDLSAWIIKPADWKSPVN